MMKKGLPYLVLLAVGVVGLAASGVQAAEDQPETAAKSMTLVRAVMCEFIEEFAPKNAAIAFSIDVGKISCFTSFNEIKTSTYTLHRWFRRDELVTTKRLTLKPPSWSTYSSIQLREEDKGPWRVEIFNDRNQLVKTLRFSVID